MKTRTSNILLIALVGFTFASVASAFVLATRGNRKQMPLPKLMVLSSNLLLTGHRYGSDAASYTLVEFGDYECPPCRGQSPFVFELVRKHQDKMGYAFKNFPLSFHADAERAATIAESTTENQKFWSVHEALMHCTDLHKYESKFDFQAKNARTAVKIIKADKALAKTLEINATPSFFLCTPEGKVYRLASFTQAEELLR